MEKSIKEIINAITYSLQNDIPVGSSTWMSWSSLLNMYLIDFAKEVFTARQEAKLIITNCLSTGSKVNAAEAIMDSSDYYRKYKELEAMMEFLRDQVQNCKAHAKLSENQFNNL